MEASADRKTHTPKSPHTRLNPGNPETKQNCKIVNKLNYCSNIVKLKIKQIKLLFKYSKIVAVRQTVAWDFCISDKL